MPADGGVRRIPELGDRSNRDAAPIRSRLYQSYSSTHAGLKDGAGERRVFERDILPHLPSGGGAKVVDLGCGQGDLVQNALNCGYVHAVGIDISAEQVAIAHGRGILQVQQGDIIEYLDGARSAIDCIVATDLLEHMNKAEVLHIVDLIHAALRPGGIFVARMPNAVSPFSGNYQYGDFTHETSFTPRAFRQIVMNTGFVGIAAYPCRPITHGAISAARAVLWKGVSGALKLAIAAETGELRGTIVTQNFVGVAHRDG